MSVGLADRLPDLYEDQWPDEPIERLERPQEDPDEELELLVVQAQEGDDKAIFLVGQAVTDRARDAVSRFISDPEDVATLTTEGLNRALQNGLVKGQYSRYYKKREENGESDVIEGGFKGWVWTVVRNHTINEMNRRKREAEHRTRFSDEHMEHLAGSERASDTADEHEGYNLVNALLASVNMPETHRDVIRLRLLGYEFAEIGEILGVPEGTVLSRHHRGIKYLRRNFSLTSDGRIPDVFANLRPVKPIHRYEATSSNRR